MQLTEHLYSELAIDNWIFDSLLRSFTHQLEKQSDAFALSKNVTELSLSHYKGLNLSKVEIRSKTLGLFDLNLSCPAKNAIQSILDRDYKGSEVGNFEIEVAKKIRFSLEIIRSTNIDLFNEISKSLVLFMRVNKTDFRSASNPLIFGAILIGDGIEVLNTDEVAISIIHEMAHQELFLINLVDRLVNEPFDHNEIHAPLQGKKRPPIGRLHSLWALYRMIGFQALRGSSNSKYLELLTKNIDAFEIGELTSFGKSLVELARRKVS